MRPSALPSPRVGVALAVAVLLGLAGLLTARMLASDAAVVAAGTPPAPAGAVPAPRPIDVARLSIPCWTCPEAQAWPLAFRTDLDLIAPLGTGTGNAADWLALFSRPDGPRLADVDAAYARRIERPGLGNILPPADPLLLEAEPWCDQAVMRFYPDVHPFTGLNTQLPNLLFALTLARSWLGRGEQQVDPEAAMADFRRVIRLGRLLRQEDATIPADAVGLACIRLGAEAIFARARQEGRLDLALAAALVAGEAAPQRLLTAARMTSTDVLPYIRQGALDLPEDRFQAVLDCAAGTGDRRFRIEAALRLAVVTEMAPPAQAARAREALEELTRGADPLVAASARAFLARMVAPEILRPAETR